MDFLSPLQAAKLLDMSTHTVRYHEKKGHLVAIRVDRMRLFIKADVERFARQRKEANEAKAA